jgi:hypothetical protein
LVTVIDDSRLAFDDQSLVTFNVRGMEALNELGPQKITITDKFNFTVDVDTTSFSPFVSGTVTEFRPSKEVNFVSRKLEQHLRVEICIYRIKWCHII